MSLFPKAARTQAKQDASRPETMWNVCITTLNCGKQFPVGDAAAVRRLVRELLPLQDGPHDIYAVGFQELASLWESSFPSIVKEYMGRIADSCIQVLDETFGNGSYTQVGQHHMGAVGLIVFASSSQLGQNEIEVAYSVCKRGTLGSSLKGSAAICFPLQGPTHTEIFTFICSHFAANEGATYETLRINDYDAIMKQTTADFGRKTLLNNHLFFYGDLNSRVRQTLHTQEPLLAPPANEELTALRAQGRIFSGFEEAPITFGPTYKYLLGSATEMASNRTPSWCDRILYRSYHTDTPPKLRSYRAIPRSSALQFTDHQAVCLQILLPNQAEDASNGPPAWPPEPPLPSATITTMVAATAAAGVGRAADWALGWGGWFVARRGPYWLAAAVLLGYVLLSRWR